MNENTTLPPYESHTVSGFRALPPAQLDNLNEALGTRVSPALSERLQRQFRDVEQRDPTVGEVRFADALVRLTANSPARCGTGEMTTDSADMAAVWSDIMANRRLLNGGGSAPCTVSELLSLTDRRLTRTGERPAADRHLFAGPDALSACLAAGCRPAMRLYAADGTERLLGITAPGVRTPAGTGDLLLLVRDVPAQKLFRLVSEGSLRPVNAAVLGDRPLPPVAYGLTFPAGIGIIGERLFPDGDDCAARLAAPEAFASAAPLSTLLLRISAAQLRQSVDILMNEGLRPIVFGQVKPTGRLEVTCGGYRTVSLGMTFLTGITAPRLCAVKLPAPANANPDCLTQTAVFTPPSAYAGEDGMTPDGTETVALTASGPAVCGYGTAMYTAGCALTDESSASCAARSVLLAAVAGAVAQGVKPDEVSLSVSLTGKPPRERGNALPEADSTVFAAACGLYRAAAELRLPMPDPDVGFSADGGRLSVTAWGPCAAPRRTDCLSGGTNTRLMLCAPAPAADGSLDYHELRAMLRALTAQADNTVRLLPLCRDGVSLRDRLTAACARAGVTFTPAPAYAGLADTVFDFALVAEVPDSLPFPGVEIGRTAPAAAPAAPDGAQTPAEQTAFRAERTAVLPILRKNREADVRALAYVLRRQGYVCTLLPLGVVMVEAETPAAVQPIPAPAPLAESDTPATDAPAAESLPDAPAAEPAPDAPIAEPVQDVPDPDPAPAPTRIPAVTDAAADELCRRLTTASLLVLAMSDGDAELLMRHPRTAAAVTAFPKTVVIGGSCRVMAAHGLLPEELTRDPEVIPAAGQLAEMTVAAIDGTDANDAAGAAVLSRLVRADLLSYSPECPHRVTVVVGGKSVPDGFVGETGAVGFVNGLPDSAEV